MSNGEKKVRLKTSAMIASIADADQKTRPAPFGHALVAAARDRKDIVGMSADLAKYTDLHIFRDTYPDRFFQMGMAEQLLMGAAAGVAHQKLMPFVTTYGAFASRRAFDFIHQAIVEDHLNVKICCALPGLTTGYGPSHCAVEDTGMFATIPNMVVIDPCDAVDIEQAVPAMIEHDGPVYMRLLRGQVPVVLEEYDYKFEIGKAKFLVEGDDVLFISTGLLTMRTLEAAKKLAEDGIKAAVLHCPTIKPLDVETILAACSKPGRLVVTAENHTIMGGLGMTIAAELLRAGVTPTFRQISLPDEFPLAGALPTLHDKYGISTTAIIRQVKEWYNA